MALPWSVLDSDAYLGLSHPAKALLLEVARQFHADDNGRMLLTSKQLSPRGWNSPEVISRAKRELLDAGLIFETVKGMRPSKASWYAVTWRKLDRIPGYDAGAEAAFEQGAYKRVGTTQPVAAKRVLTTAPVVERPQRATAPVVGNPSTTTPDVARSAVFDPPPTTSPVHPLEMPSAVAGSKAVGAAGPAPAITPENSAASEKFDRRLLESLERRKAEREGSAQ